MKKFLLKSLLVAVGLLTGGSAWAREVPYSIGESSSSYRAVYSDPYTVKNGETLHITFTNNNYDGSETWFNYLIEATSEVDKHEGVYFDLRADNYAFDAGTFVQNYNGNCLSDLNGATVDNYITYSGGVITVNQFFTKSEVTTYNRVYTYTVAGSPKSVIIYVTVDHATVTITNVETSKWSTVWTTDFSSAPSGMTYSINAGTMNIDNGYLLYYTPSQNNPRTTTLSFTGDNFNVDTDWVLEFDWNCGSSNTNGSNVVFATNNGTAFTMSWVQYATGVVVTDASSKELTTTLPLLGYNHGTCSSWSHVTITGDAGNGVYLTITNNGTTYVNNQLVTATFGYPKTFNGTLGKNVSSMFVDNIVFRTPAVAGFVATPTYTITAPDGTNRKFTLECLTENTTIYYATSDLEKGAAGWETYSGEVTTDAATIYAYAEDDEDNTSEKMNFETGVGTTITLERPTLTKTAYAGGNYTVSISSDQSSLDIVPASTVIKYSIDGGSEETYSSAIAVPAGSSVSAHVEAEGYIRSLTKDLDTGIQPNLTENWAQDYVGKVTGDITLYEDGEGYHNCVVSEAGSNYYVYSSDGTSAFTNANAGFQVYDGKSPRKWMIRESTGGGGMYNFTAGNAGVAIANLTVGQIVKVESNGGFSATSGVTQLDDISYGTVGYYEVTSAGTAYFTAARNAYVKNITVYNATVPVTITSAEWATLFTQHALNFSGVGLTAYTATVSENTVNLTEVNDVPANTGVVLHGAEGNYNIPVIASSSTAQGELTGNASSSTEFNAFSGYTLYVLKPINGGRTVQFNNVTSGSIEEGKAFLKIANTPSGSAPSLKVAFTDEMTGIDEVNAPEAAANGCFNLAGQRVANPTKGLYIVNGKKVLVK